MAETDKTIAIRVQAHLRSAGRPVPALGDIVPLIQTGLEDLSRLIARDPMRRRELWPAIDSPFNVAITNGVSIAGSLAGMLAAPNRLLLAEIPYAHVFDAATGNRLYFLGRDRYDLGQPPMYGYFTIEGQNLLARLKGDMPGASSFTAGIIGNFAPTSDKVPPSCVPDAVLIIARLATALPAEGQA